MDGHRAVRNTKVNEDHSRTFDLVLSAIEDDPHALHFFIHARPKIGYPSGGLQPAHFLARVGYGFFDGQCPFVQDRCLWIHLGAAVREPFADDDQVMMIHAAFKGHAQALPDLYESFRNIVGKLQLRGSSELDLFPELRTRTPPVLEPAPGAIPQWVAAEMPSRFAEVNADLQALLAEATELRSIAGLLWETGDPLEQAVRNVFKALGYEVERTPKGKTYDVTVSLPSAGRLLLEVTGIAGALKKDSNKVGQAFQALQQEAGTGDRVILAFNAHRERPVRERGLETVTPEALALMTGMGVSIVTTTTLFNIWKLFLTDPEAARNRIGQLAAHPGGLFT